MTWDRFCGQERERERERGRVRERLMRTISRKRNIQEKTLCPKSFVLASALLLW